MNSKQQIIALVVVGGVVAIWLYEQNQIWQDKIQKISAASEPVGKLSATVDANVPRIVDLLDFWVHRESF